MPTLPMASLLLLCTVPQLSAQATVNQDCDPRKQFELRFVSVDGSAFDGPTRRRFDSLENARGKTSHIDTAFVWRGRADSWLRRRWTIRLGASDADQFMAWNDRIYWRRVDTVSESIRSRFATLAPIAPCLSGRQLRRFYHAQPHKVTTAEVVRAHIEPTYVTIPFLMFGLPKEVHTNLGDANPRPQALPLLYEGTISPAFLFQLRRKPWLVSVTPKVVIRQFYRGSQPVPAPSFMPRASLYYWGPGIRSLMPWKYSFPYAWIMVSHHSNGQEGNPIDPATGQPNYQTGNFSANFLELGYSETNGGPGLGLLTMELAASYQPDAWSDPAEHLYGRGRIRAAVDAFVPAIIGADGYSSVRLELTWMGGPMAPATYGSWNKRLNTSLTFKWKPVSITDFAFFANSYVGQDYYNIRFDRRISVIRIGLIANPLHFLFEVPET